MSTAIKSGSDASAWQKRYDATAPRAGDLADDAVNIAYAAWLTRLYLVGLDGRVVYGSGLGPSDFKPTKLEDAIERYLAKMAVHKFNRSRLTSYGRKRGGHQNTW